MMSQKFYGIAELLKQREGSGKRYLEFLRIPAMSAGVYVLARLSMIPDGPQRGRVVLVVRGRARACVQTQRSAMLPRETLSS